jgi:purine-nucleoside phosphorylase
MKQLVAKPVSQAVDFLKTFSKQAPACAVILGSGVKVLEDLSDTQTVSYQQAFGMSPQVLGHAGSVSLGHLGGKLVCVLRGRFHLYEGHNWDVVTMVTRVMVEWGVPHLYLTNAAGGLNSDFAVGDLMVLSGYRDMLNSQYAETGLLEALHKPASDCRNALTDGLLAAGKKLEKTDSSFRALRSGVYAGLLGPSYETLAEIAMLKKLGADAVGMSTVPELLTAGIPESRTTAAAVSVITNVWSPDEIIGGHEEVLQAAKEASLRLDKLFKAAISA